MEVGFGATAQCAGSGGIKQEVNSWLPPRINLLPLENVEITYGVWWGQPSPSQRQ